MTDNHPSTARRIAALIAAACTLGSLAVTPLANADSTPSAADKNQTSQTPQTPSGTDQTDVPGQTGASTTADPAGKTDGTNQPGETDKTDQSGNADGSVSDDTNTGSDATDDKTESASVATVKSGDVVTSYATFAAALAAAKTGDTVTLVKSSSESVDVANVNEDITVTAADGAVYSGTMTARGAVTITGMTFSLDGADGKTTTSIAVRGAGNVKIESNTFGVAADAASNSYFGIYVTQGAARVSISGNTFTYTTAVKNFNRTAIYVTGEDNPVSDITVTRNTMRVTGDAANKGEAVFVDATGGRGAGSYDVTNLQVTNNTVTAETSVKDHASGVVVQGVKGLTFTGNTFTGLHVAVGNGARDDRNMTNTDVKVGGNDFTGTTKGYNFVLATGGALTVDPDKVDAEEPPVIAGKRVVAGVTQADGSYSIYATLADAINAATSGATVRLMSDVTLTGTLSIDKKITLDGRNHSLSGQLQLGAAASGTTITNVKFVSGSDPSIVVSGADGVTIADNTFNQDGTASPARLIDFRGGAKNIAITGNVFGPSTHALYFGTSDAASAPQENVDVKGNTFYGANAVTNRGGIKEGTLKYHEYFGTKDANKFGSDTQPYNGSGSAADKFGVTYRDSDSNKTLLGWEEVANGGKVQNVPAKSGYRVRWYKNGDVTQPFYPARDKVTSNLTLVAVWTWIPTPGPSPTPTPTPSGLEVTYKPNKTTYKIGEKFDTTGMVVKYQGSVLGPDQYTVTFDSSKPGKVKAYITLNADPTKATTVEVTVVVSDVEVRRLYNPKSSEHFYVSSENEYNALVKSGQWNVEGTAFTMVDYGTPVYRLYNPGGKHLFTTSEKERDVLKAAGWNYEGVAFHVSDDAAAKTEVHRLYNTRNGDHLLTTSVIERTVLKLAGWRDEGVAFTAK